MPSPPDATSTPDTGPRPDPSLAPLADPAAAPAGAPSEAPAGAPPEAPGPAPRAPHPGPSGETARDDVMTSWLRTTVPTLWGASVTAATTALAPHLPAGLGDAAAAWLGSEATTLAVAVGAVAVWHATWRRLERRAPRWLVRLALGSPRTPSYAP